MQQWSQKYYEGLPQGLHDINNKWFGMMTSFLKDDGVLYVPDLDKSFNKQGEEVNA
jgi:hypothetical protein